MRALIALTLLVATQAIAVPIEHYRLTYEIFEQNGRPDRLPSSFGDLSVGATLNVDICWNSQAQAFPDNALRYADAVCGYTIQLGDYTALNLMPSGGALTTYGHVPNSGFGFSDPAPRLAGPDTASWYLDDIQFSLTCSTFGSTLPNQLDCASGDLFGYLAVGPLTHPNAFPCTTYCGAGGSVFAELLGVRPIAVPEPATIGLLALGILGIRLNRRAKLGR
jgi:hypothetical protein